MKSPKQRWMLANRPRKFKLLDRKAAFAMLMVVASSLLVPEGGWNYKFWLNLTGEHSPHGAREWAQLAVQAFELAHPQLGDFPPAQLAAFSTQNGDLVKALAKVRKARKRSGSSC